VFPANKARSAITAGLLSAAFGVILYTQMTTVVENLTLSWAVLKTLAMLSVAATIGGSVTATIGACVWGRRAPVSQVVLVAVSVGTIAVLLGAFGNINVHLPNFMLFFVVLIAVPGSVLLLLIALTRWLRSRSRNAIRPG